MLRPARGSRGRSPVLVGAATVGIALAIVLSGCTNAPTPAPSHTRSASATPTPTPTPDPVLRPELGAKQNQAYFDFVNKKTIAANATPTSRQLIDGLVAAGFHKQDMLVTADKTTIDLTPGSIQFSVRFNGECLIGQYGEDGVGYHSEVTAVLSTGNCLIGQTVPIDW